MRFFNKILVQEIKTGNIVDITNLDKKHYESFLEAMQQLNIVYLKKMKAKKPENISKIEEILERVDGQARKPFVTARFGNNWKEHASDLNIDDIVEIAWYQGRRAILLERIIEKLIK